MSLLRQRLSQDDAVDLGAHVLVDLRGVLAEDVGQDHHGVADLRVPVVGLDDHHGVHVIDPIYQELAAVIALFFMRPGGFATS